MSQNAGLAPLGPAMQNAGGTTLGHLYDLECIIQGVQPPLPECRRGNPVDRNTEGQNCRPECRRGNSVGQNDGIPLSVQRLRGWRARTRLANEGPCNPSSEFSNLSPPTTTCSSVWSRYQANLRRPERFVRPGTISGCLRRGSVGVNKKESHDLESVSKEADLSPVAHKRNRCDQLCSSTQAGALLCGHLSPRKESAVVNVQGSSR
ncbi:hypothetical protein PoB_002653500 [Plakobranchus ocellatus]|uniref:Uncharacterized protein n=1 Tax=Plakobranchus ocellatus TaxID=259542 RepID=A0AAV3ZZD5_9GAST|nr:hypothetical protein PoB_002653500 [Plakobranchus ocellatus]